MLAQDLLSARDQPVELAVALGTELDQQRSRSGRQLHPVLRGAGDVLRRDHQGRRDHQLDGRRTRLDQRRDRLGRRLDAVEVEPGDGRRRWERHGLDDRLGDEAERPLGADQKPPEDLDRLVRVEEGAEPVARGVLDAELLPDPLGELVVGSDLVPNLRESARKFGLGPLESLGRVGRGGVDHGPGRQHEGEREDGAVGVRDDPASHPARVVGEYAADAGDVGAGRVRAELASVWRQHPIGMPEHGPRLHPHPGPVVEHLHPTPVPADVDQDSVGLRLAVQAGAAGAEGDRDLGRARVVEDLRDVPGITGHHNGPGELAVRAGVRGVADQVDDSGEDAILSEQADQLAAQRFGRPRGELVRRPVLRRLAPLRRDPVHVRGKQIHAGSLVSAVQPPDGSPAASRAASRSM